MTCPDFLSHLFLFQTGINICTHTHIFIYLYPPTAQFKNIPVNLRNKKLAFLLKINMSTYHLLTYKTIGFSTAV